MYCHLPGFVSYVPYNDINFSQSAQGIHFTSCQNTVMYTLDWNTKYVPKNCLVCFCLLVFNTTFNNISVISWWLVLLAEETEGPGENHFCAYLAVIHSNVIMCPFYAYHFSYKTHVFVTHIHIGCCCHCLHPIKTVSVWPQKSGQHCQVWREGEADRNPWLRYNQICIYHI